MINLLVIESNDLLYQGISAVCASSSRIQITQTAGKLQQALNICRYHHINVLLINGQQLHFSSLNVLQILRRTWPDIGIIIHSSNENIPFLLQALEIGVQGMLSQNAKAEDLLHVIRIVNTRQRFLSPDIAQALVLKRATLANRIDLHHALSKREMEIFLLLTQGLSATAIAEQLGVSPKTVNTYRYRMFSKLNVRSDVELTHIAINYGLIKTEQVVQGV